MNENMDEVSLRLSEIMSNYMDTFDHKSDGNGPLKDILLTGAICIMFLLWFHKALFILAMVLLVAISFPVVLMCRFHDEGCVNTRELMGRIRNKGISEKEVLSTQLDFTNPRRRMTFEELLNDTLDKCSTPFIVGMGVLTLVAIV